MTYYTHLTIDELTFIDSYSAGGYSSNKIARRLGMAQKQLYNLSRKQDILGIMLS